MGLSGNAERWIKLLSVRDISASEWQILKERFSLQQLVEMAGCAEGLRELSSLTGREVRGIDRLFVEKHITAAANNILKVITLDEERYPPLLREIPDPPQVLFYRGDLPGEKSLNIAVVGSRSACRRGLITAERIGEELSARSVTVVSGLARGIDTAAHTGALRGGGGTAAVTGCGLDIAYPPENCGLAIDISSNGCIITEYPLGTPPLRHHFPRRNRILSGLSSGVVIVEAGVKSGAMITARWAADQGREVFAVPGPVEHPGSAGPHRLIKEGAMLVESGSDILGFLYPFGAGPEIGSAVSRGKTAGLKGLDIKIVNALELEPVHVDILAREVGVPAAELMPVLLRLEMDGYCRRTGGGMFALQKL